MLGVIEQLEGIGVKPVAKKKTEGNEAKVKKAEVKASKAKPKKATKAKPNLTLLGRTPPDPEVVLRPKPKKKGSPFEGKTFHITAMEGWGPDYFNAEVQAHVTLGKDGSGRFQFGYVRGWMDYRETTREGRKAVEWSWVGRDHGGGDDMTGRGWATVREDGGLEGRIFIHMGDDSGFAAEVG